MSSPTPGKMPTHTPITPERRMVRQYFSTSMMRGSGEPNSAGEIGIAEAEALVGIHAFLADAGDEQAEKAREPTLERVGSDHVARHDDAEEGEPEELEGAEAQRHFAQHRGEQRQADEAEQRADDRTGRGDPHGATRLPLAGELVAVEASGGVRGRA